MLALVESFRFFDVSEWGRASVFGMVATAGGRLLGVGVAIACGDVLFVIVGMIWVGRRCGGIFVGGGSRVVVCVVEGEVSAGGSGGEGEGDVEVPR